MYRAHTREPRLRRRLESTLLHFYGISTLRASTPAGAAGTRGTPHVAAGKPAAPAGNRAARRPPAARSAAAISLGRCTSSTPTKQAPYRLASKGRRLPGNDRSANNGALPAIPTSNPGDSGPSSRIICLCSRPNSKLCSQVSRAISVYRDPKELFPRPRRRTSPSRQLQLRRASFFITKPPTAFKTRCSNPSTAPASPSPTIFPPKRPSPGGSGSISLPVIISSRDQETRFPRMMEVHRALRQSSLPAFLPLTTAHRRLGSLSFGLQQPNGYSEEDARYLSLVADQVALAVDNALRHREQQAVEEALRKQKAHFEKLFELAPEAIVLRDIENRVLRANREFTKLFGYSHRRIRRPQHQRPDRARRHAGGIGTAARGTRARRARPRRTGPPAQGWHPDERFVGRRPRCGQRRSPSDLQHLS